MESIQTKTNHLSGLWLIFIGLIIYVVAYILQIFSQGVILMNILVIGLDLVVAILLAVGTFKLKENREGFRKAAGIYLGLIASGVISFISTAIATSQYLASISSDPDSIYTRYVREQATSTGILAAISTVALIVLTIIYCRHLLYTCGEIALDKGHYRLHKQCKNAWGIFTTTTIITSVSSIILLLTAFELVRIVSEAYIFLTIIMVVGHITGSIVVCISLYKTHKNFNDKEVKTIEIASK